MGKVNFDCHRQHKNGKIAISHNYFSMQLVAQMVALSMRSNFYSQSNLMCWTKFTLEGNYWQVLPHNT